MARFPFGKATSLKQLPRTKFTTDGRTVWKTVIYARETEGTRYRFEGGFRLMNFPRVSSHAFCRNRHRLTKKSQSYSVLQEGGALQTEWCKRPAMTRFVAQCERSQMRKVTVASRRVFSNPFGLSRGTGRHIGDRYRTNIAIRHVGESTGEFVSLDEGFGRKCTPSSRS